MATTSDRFRNLVAASRDERRLVRQLVDRRQWREAEPDKTRLRDYLLRRARAEAPRGAEALIGDTNDLQTAAFLPRGAAARRAVAYIEVNVAGRSQAGTGFLVSPDLFLTNQHVIPTIDAARGAQVTFDREIDESGRPRPTTSFLLDPDRFAVLSREEELDYALIAIGAVNSGPGKIADFGYCALFDQPNRHIIGMNVNIVQHPNGLPKMIAVRNNLLDFRTDRTLLYETDTDHGSSGSPVFNDAWEVVALHHYGEPFLEHADDQGRPIPSSVNEGVRISAIYHDLQARLASLAPAARALLQAALDIGRNRTAPGGGKTLSRHPGATGAETGASVAEGVSMADPPPGQELRFVVPLEISVRVGVATATPGLSPLTAALPLTPASPLTPGAAVARLAAGGEKLRIDQDYANRRGYDPDFIAGVRIALPQADATLARQIAPLRAGEADPAGGELKYEHFSIRLNRSKRMAMFSATNIDGASYLNVERSTGLVRAGAEAEAWFLDPRISASFILDRDFYSAWSAYFDHGHLTRRADPSWGTAAEAERANADTFHFTNSTPQHFRFNQSARFWQGVERYVLEKGTLATDAPARLSVFQGPIFLDAIDLFADDVQIPSSFFKIVAWRGATGLRSVGLVVDQLALLNETRVNLGRPRDLPVDIKQWRVGIAAIESRTGLDFGADIRAADTIAAGPAPTVGEAETLLRAMADIVL